MIVSTRSSPLLRSSGSAPAGSSPEADEAGKAKEAQKPAEAEKPARNIPREVVLSSACATGGLAGGYFLGGLTGVMMNNVPRLGSLAPYTATAGGALGALWGAALYMSGNDDAVSTAIKGGAAATAGGTLGMLAGVTIMPTLARWIGSASYAVNGPLLATAAGLLTGAALNRAGENDIYSQVVKEAASASLGATLGWVAAGGAAALLRLLDTGATLSYAPAAGLVTGGLLGMTLYHAARRALQNEGAGR